MIEAINMALAKDVIKKLQETLNAVIPHYIRDTGSDDRKLGTHAGKENKHFQQLIDGCL